METRFDKVATLALVVSVVAMASVVVRREVVTARHSRSITINKEPRPPEFWERWRDLLQQGHTVGDPRAPVQLIEFIDLECPACRSFHRGTLQSIRAKFGRSMAITYLHLPLKMHRFSRMLAVAAECASRNRRFEEFSDLALSKQDSIGLKSWGSYALEARIEDSASFVQCVTNPAPVPRIDSGIAIAQRMKVTGTPTLVLNGWRFFVPPSETELTQGITRILLGKEPFTLKSLKAGGGVRGQTSKLEQ